ncbi:hypothetical protein HKK52_07155 [Pseudomonas sp. ADAK2]|uniref:hypothetical protein n=1 Tax=unclassified Pseudomonas TaxID=196821 RepID=UPI0014638036|nr:MULTISPECIES: hypothetical protein [unclassified Pseudomonas]QJI40702.1 hypothetical protein HKK53_07150 [Pseudomonas sp. ADAK7]QJI47006.1 hypothetical protein HKK52_07155 [Pseudomonas sp. ADAK2]
MNDVARPAPPGATKHLTTVSISSRAEWVDTLSVKQGERYFFRASGNWWDALIRCDANGYNRHYLDRFKHHLRCTANEAGWFTLIGGIAREDASVFAIGDGSRWQDGWVAPVDGPLTCFANDWDKWYWNNLFSIDLEIWQ